MSSLFYKFICLLPNIRGAFRLACLLDKIGPFSVKTPKGIWIKAYLSSTNDRAFIRKNHENPALVDAIKALNDRSVFIDIGANVGYYSSLAAKQIGENGLVISVEPSPREFQRLLWNRSTNHSRAKWLCINEGSGANSGLLPLAIAKHHTGMNTFAENSINTQTVWVPVNPLDELIRRLQITQKIDLVKIDVEGWEFEVLKGLATLLDTKVINKVILEVTEEWLLKTGSSKSDLYSWMRNRGYRALVNSKEWQYDEVFVCE